MNSTIDAKKTLEIAERMQFAKIGEYKKWQNIISKIKNNQPLNPSDYRYCANMTRIYKNSKTSNRSKIYHSKLSEQDEKPICQVCDQKSSYYCNMNDQYFCTTHVVGHDENEC